MSKAKQIQYRTRIKNHPSIMDEVYELIIPKLTEFRTVSQSGDIFIVYEYLSGKCGAGESCNCKARFYTMRDDVAGEPVKKYDYEVEHKSIFRIGYDEDDSNGTIAARGLSFAATSEEAQLFIRSRLLC